MLEVSIKRKLPGFVLDVKFTVNQEIMAILGPSGSGKTMTLQCIAGLTQPDEGFIKLNDKILFDSTQNINLSPQRRKVGLVFQNYALFPHLTVSQNIAYGIQDRTLIEKKERVTQLLGKMHIGELGQRFPKQLSSGQQQRVALARALAPEPDILLLDEPFSALDSQVQERLAIELLSLQSFYKGNILLVTHNLAEGYKMASRIAVYYSGQVIQCDSKQKVIISPANHTVARLTGVRNLFKGSVIEIQGENAFVLIPEFQEKVRIELKGTAKPVLNQSINLGIRPEYVHLSDNPVENTLKCVVDRMIEGIASIDCFFYIQGKTDSRHLIEATLSKADAGRISTGQECFLHLHPEHLNILKD